MNKTILAIGIVLSVLIISSCLKDLDVKPLNKSVVLTGNLADDPNNMKQALGKIYASFIISGQGDNNGGTDITPGDPNFNITARALWNCQEITTDEAICGWTDVGITDFNTQTWTPTNPFITALYQRLGLTITYANDYIGNTNGSSDPDIKRYNAEARFLRALAYYYYMDLFGNPPFTTDADGVGIFFPKQIKRDKLFTYIESELHDIQNLLGEPGYSYPQADKGSCWMLMARMYLNAKVFTKSDENPDGTEMWDSCKVYCDKVIDCGAYSLATNYRQNFCADNDYPQNPEMIFAFAEDGTFTQGYGGTTFIIESCSDATYLSAKIYHGLKENTNWNGNRARIQFLNVLIDTLATYGNVPIPASDTIFAQCKDKRIFLKMKLSMDIPSPGSSGDYGIGVYKFTARKSNDDTTGIHYNTFYASTDFPIFRLADAYLMRAEAFHNMDDDGSALPDINLLRERAYGNTSGNITVDKITDQFILDERGREFYYEAQRRTDLVRFGQFTEGTYNWVWKGGTYEGSSTESYRNIFPIPGDEVSANPFIKQNDGYN
jgi:starch-binding outer membrane protein, SusD/RagB family